MRAGQKIRFVNPGKYFINFGNCDSPIGQLRLGQIVTITKVKVHYWCTKVELVGYPNLKFNSMHFEETE